MDNTLDRTRPIGEHEDPILRALTQIIKVVREEDRPEILEHLEFTYAFVNCVLQNEGKVVRRMTKRIDQIYAFVTVDPEDDTEGITAFHGPRSNAWIPMVGADMERIDRLRPIARDIAKATGRPIHLLRFSQRTGMEVIHP